MWELGWIYLKKAGTVILVISILLWTATSYPKPAPADIQDMTDEQIQQMELTHSLTGRLSRTVEPVMKPLGFDWKITAALVGALGAKEVFVSQMSIMYSLGESESGSQALQKQLRQNYTPLVGFCVSLSPGRVLDFRKIKITAIPQVDVGRCLPPESELAVDQIQKRFVALR